MQAKEERIRLVVGLGNPDPALIHTYHNAGMLFIAALAARLGDPSPAFKRYKDSFQYAAAGPLTLVRPLTYMNESGRAVKDALKVLKAIPAQLAVAHDDSDLTLGSFKIVRGGGAAGHKGILSIVAQTGTEDFLRIRIGIRPAGETHRRKAGDFVLSPISPADGKTLEKTFEKISEKLAAEAGY